MLTLPTLATNSTASPLQDLLVGVQGATQPFIKLHNRNADAHIKVIKMTSSGSTSRCDLIIPKHRTNFAEHAFIVAGPMEWPETGLHHQSMKLSRLQHFTIYLTRTYLRAAYSDS